MLGFKILVAYDGSDLANKALTTAQELTKDNSEATIDVVFVEEAALLQNGVAAIDEKIQQRDDRLFADLQTKMQDKADRVKLHRLRGREAPYVILHFAEEHHSDLIVIGSRGLTGLSELLGSVSHAVVQHAPIPVLVVK